MPDEPDYKLIVWRGTTRDSRLLHTRGAPAKLERVANDRRIRCAMRAQGYNDYAVRQDDLYERTTANE